MAILSRYTGFIFLLLFCSQNAFAGKLLKKAEMDSLRRVAAERRKAEADSIRQEVVPEVFSIEQTDSLLQQIEHLHATLNNITNQTKYGFKTQEIENNLHRMEAAKLIITQNMSRDSTVMSVNNLELFRRILIDMGDQLHTWRDVLYTDNHQLSDMTAEMKAFVKDSFTREIAADTAFAKLHLDEMLVLRDKWHEAKSSTKANLDHIAALQTEVSTNYFDVTELQNKVSNQLAGEGTKTFAREYNYIWIIHSNYSIAEVLSYTAQSFRERMSILSYYLILKPQAWSSVLIAGLIFFTWVFWNFRKVKAAATPQNKEDANFLYILPVPVLSTLIFILGVAPFYGLDQPAIYVEVLHMLILVPLTLVFWRIWNRQLFLYWCVLIILSIIIFIVNAVITPGWPLRFILLGVNILSLVLALRFHAAYNRTPSPVRPVKWATLLYIVMNLLAIFANTFGRLALTKILTSSAICGLTQMLGLFVLVPILTEAFYLQMKSRRLHEGMSLKFNYEQIGNDLYRLLMIVAVFLWLITLATNLEVYDGIAGVVDQLLNTPRKVGSTAFTLGNILTFVLILYVVSVLQKYVGYFFGETEDDLVGDLDKKESWVVIFRLIIIMAGFFMAVVASGLPVDKVTVVLGALGVGIGLGLQNIVFNLVSGVILIFEKPMQIGDYIEVADKQGRVQSIGIRSSKLITSDGSEVIVPNGDILSSHMVNWTRSNNNRRAQFAVTIEPASGLETAKEIILQELKHSPHVIQDRQVEILVNNLSEKSAELQVNVWIKSIYQEHQFKSEALAGIYSHLAEKGIKIV